jgi:hypothetical protein
MNERIKHLAEQVDKEFNSPYDRYKAIERFAELIVRECLACARGAGLADDVAVRNGLGFNDGISEAVTHMKQHFGVEE